MHYRLLLLFLVVGSGTAAAQYQDRIDSGRPAQYFGARSVGNNVFQVQSGLQTNFADHASIRNYTPTVFNNIFRYGIHERVELRFTLDYAWTRYQLPNDGFAGANGFSDAQVGLRVNLYDGADGLAVGAQSTLLLLDTDPDFRRATLGSNWLVSATRPLSDKLGAGVNLFAVWAGDGRGDATWNYAAFLTYNLTDDLVPFVEVFGPLNDGARVDFNFGLGYLIGDDLQLDLYAGWVEGLEDADFFLSAGVSWRLDWRETPGAVPD